MLCVDSPDRSELFDQRVSNEMGKRSTNLDLTSNQLRLEQLPKTADVVLLEYRLRSLKRFGLASSTPGAADPPGGNPAYGRGACLS